MPKAPSRRRHPPDARMEELRCWGGAGTRGRGKGAGQPSRRSGPCEMWPNSRVCQAGVGVLKRSWGRTEREGGVRFHRNMAGWKGCEMLKGSSGLSSWITSLELEATGAVRAALGVVTVSVSAS